MGADSILVFLGFFGMSCYEDSNTKLTHYKYKDKNTSVLELIKQAFMGGFNCFFDRLIVMFRVRVRESLCCFLEEEKERID